LARRGCALRLDKFLYFVRFAKSRSKAQALILEGSPRIDGRAVPSLHADIKIGETLTIMIEDRIRIIRVTAHPTRRGPASEARLSYTDMLSGDAPIP
jgi:ribosome-associated heat shock protein Hsp15